MLTAERARELLSYDPATGEFRWKVTNSNRCKAGNVAGWDQDDGKGRVRICITVDGKKHKAHRLAWLITHGVWPPQLIDHINGNSADNRLCNLRLATPSQNSFNRGEQSTNTSGHKGVWRKYRRWRADIWANGRKHGLGSYATKEEAAAAYQRAAQQLHGEYWRV